MAETGVEAVTADGSPAGDVVLVGDDEALELFPLLQAMLTNKAEVRKVIINKRLHLIC